MRSLRKEVIGIAVAAKLTLDILTASSVQAQEITPSPTAEQIQPDPLSKRLGTGQLVSTLLFIPFAVILLGFADANGWRRKRG